jgi:tetratricopeptide (TPR) repeat protein
MNYWEIPVLLAEDNANMRRTLRAMLRTIGFETVIEAADGEEALDRLEDNEVGLIVCDWNMPHLSGMDVLKTIREDERWSDLPFLIVTAEIQEEIVAQAGEREVDAYIIKPFSSAMLSEKIDRILRRRGSPSETAKLLSLAETYHKAGNLDEARVAYNQILQREPNYGPALLGLGETALTLGNLDEAEKWLLRAVELHPKFVKAHDALGRLYTQRGEEEKAAEAIQAAVDVSPLESKRQVNLAAARARTGDIEGAREALNMAVEIDPEAEKDSKVVAEAMLEAGQHDEAIALYERSLKADPKAMETYNRMGIALRREERYGEALELYERAMGVSPRNPIVMYNKACCYLEWGKTRMAQRAFETALEFDPKFKVAREALEVLRSRQAT